MSPKNFQILGDIIILEEQSESHYDLKKCTQVIGKDLHQMELKYRENISSPVMSKKPQWSSFNLR
jgi:tRNA G37 N-methylase Trm5